jgi:hypothetical protein
MFDSFSCGYNSYNVSSKRFDKVDCYSKIPLYSNGTDCIRLVRRDHVTRPGVELVEHESTIRNSTEIEESEICFEIQIGFVSVGDGCHLRQNEFSLTSQSNDIHIIISRLDHKTENRT